MRILDDGKEIPDMNTAWLKKYTKGKDFPSVLKKKVVVVECGINPEKARDVLVSLRNENPRGRASRRRFEGSRGMADGWWGSGNPTIPFFSGKSIPLPTKRLVLPGVAGEMFGKTWISFAGTRRGDFTWRSRSDTPPDPGAFGS
ncbi:MAG: hypothetical protein MZU97_03325 [Bacillus subtilis]|nr:hypothetical protein [Bacillus subtilis]